MFSINFNDAPNSAKAFILIILILPFWYVAIDMFHPGFFHLADFKLILSYCICLTLASSVVFSFNAHYTLLEFHSRNKSDDSSIFNPITTALSIIFQISWFSILFFVLYIFNQMTGKSLQFYGFVAVYFTVPVILATVSLINDGIKNKRN